jgi:nitrite reductase (NO-forming)
MTTTARCRIEVILLLLGMLAANLGFAAAPPHHHVAQAPGVAPSPQSMPKSPAAEYVPNVRFRLRTALAEGKLAFVGVGGGIEGVVNPTLRVAEGAAVQVDLLNDDGIEHDVAFPDFDAATERVAQKGASSVTVFRADAPGEFAYFCSVPGHRPAGMEGKLIVGAPRPAAPAPIVASLTRVPTDLPGPLTPRPPAIVRVDFEAVEVVGRLDEDTTYPYWTFNGQVPGPFVRVRVGDTVEVHVKNQPTSRMIHSVDFHAATGPGGGAVLTQVPPGEVRVFTFQALNPGLYVYHCATPMVAHHVTSGMYGLILVEPEGGCPPWTESSASCRVSSTRSAPLASTGPRSLAWRSSWPSGPNTWSLTVPWGR